jgi:hypothetical protein
MRKIKADSLAFLGDNGCEIAFCASADRLTAVAVVAIRASHCAASTRYSASSFAPGGFFITAPEALARGPGYMLGGVSWKRSAIGPADFED